MQITIAGIDIPNWQSKGASVKLRLFASDAFTDADGVRRIGGAVGSLNFFQEVTGTVSGTTATLPPFATVSTTDAIDNANVRITAAIYDATGSKKGIYLDSFQVPISLGTAITWAQITVYNRTAQRPPSPTFYQNAEQINAVIQQQISNVAISDATATIAGRVKLTTPPNPAGNPKAVSDTDPNYLALKQTANVASFASLNAAVAAVSASASAPNASVLAVSQSSNVTANLTVPANVALKFDGSGMINVAAGNTLTVVNGAGLQAPDDQQLFSGAGKVLFTGAYPSIWHPEWFGAKGDNSTDDLPAFNKMIAAMAKVGISTLNARIAGGNIKLATGKTYFLNGTWRIDLPVHLYADGGDRFTCASELRFPGNVTGIITDGAFTTGLPGQDPRRIAQTPRFENFGLLGAPSVDNAVVDMASDFTITLKNTGAIKLASTQGQDGAAAIPPGSTVKIGNGYYVVSVDESLTPSATIKLAKPVLTVTTYGGTSDTLTLNGQWASADWVGSTVTLGGGGSYTIKAVPDSGHIVLTVPVNFSGDLEIQNIAPLSSRSARLNIYHGLNPLGTIDVKGVRIYGFCGNGLCLNSNQYPSPYPGNEPNNDLSTFSNMDIEYSEGSGIVIYGVNSQPMEFRSMNVEYSRGWAVFEEGSSGVVFITPHTNQNASGTYRLAGASATSVMIMPYVEGGQPRAILGNTIAINPINMGVDPNKGSQNVLHGSGGQITSDSGFRYQRGSGTFAGQYASQSLLFRIGSYNGANEFLAFGAGEDQINTGNGYPAEAASVPSYVMAYDQLKRGWTSLYFGGNSNLQAQSLLAFSHDAASEGGGQLWMQSGFYAGRFDQGKRRRWQFVSAIPTSGAVELGDIFWNNGAGVGVSAPLGWIVTTAGTIGSAAVLTPFGGKTVAVNLQTGTTYAVQASDLGKLIVLTNSAPITLTIPAGLGAGFNFAVKQNGAGQITFAGSGTTLQNVDGHTKTKGLYAVVSFVSDAANIHAFQGATA